MKAPKVSIVMSVFNEEERLAESIDSCLCQTFGSFELIIIDDGSTDRTGEILSSYLKQDQRIRVVRQNNRGLAASLNTGISEAKGELIARMDADDIALPERLERQVEFLKRHPSVDVLGSAALLRSVSGQDLGILRLPEDHDTLVQKMYRSSPFIHPSVIIRKRVFCAAGGYNERINRAQDYELWSRLFKEYRFHNLQEPLMVYTFAERLSFSSVLQAAQVRILVGYRVGKLLAAVFYASLNVFLATLSIIGLRKPGAIRGKFKGD